jgi:hypothetical protein
LIAPYRTVQPEVVAAAKAHVGAIEAVLADDQPSRAPAMPSIRRRS